jgi:tetratricopeptide (TPR) repeat protein
VALDRVGRLLAESFLPAPIADQLGAELSRARLAHQSVRVGVVCPGPLSALPWEALPDRPGGRPLALTPLVNVHRRLPASPPAAVPGPLRILVAISSPEGGGAVLDYEQELRNVLKAVRTARQVDADVRVVAFATTAAIRAALEAAPAHVLHLSGHASPGLFAFEHDDGAVRPLDADTFVDEAIPPGRMPAVIALAACSTNVAGATGAPSFAGRLLARGTSVVIASETSVTDVYATRVFARIYGRLASASEPDVVAAVSDARRTVQAELDASADERDRQLGSLGEWAVLSVLAPGGAVPIFDPRVSEPPSPPAPRVTIGAVTARAVGDFVGRRSEQRHWPTELVAEQRSGIVLHGIGGAGKTTLAEELVGRLLEHEPGRVLAVQTGPLTVEGVLGAMGSALRRELLVRQQFEGTVAQALGIVARTDVPWSDRLAILRQHVLGTVPLLVVLDNFEDNLDQGALRDPILSALLAAWVADPGLSRLLVTCRYPFVLPDGAEQRLAFKALGPLSAAETRKLLWSLPALDDLTDAEVDRVWRMVGGHPRSLEYLDALLSGGKGRYPDITARLRKAVINRLGADKAGRFLQADHHLDGALAEVATLAADDVLLDDLLASLRATPEAEALLIGASVYREPVDVNALLFQVGEPDEDAAHVPDVAGAEKRVLAMLEAAGIATDQPVDLAELPADLQAAIAPHLAEQQRAPTPPRGVPEDLPELAETCMASSLLAIASGEAGERCFVQRWTADELGRRLTDDGRDDEIHDAHRNAADYWRWRVSVWPQDRHADVHDLLEARHHLLAAGRVEQAGEVTESVCSQLHTFGAWDDEAALIHDTLARLPDTSDRRAAWIHQLGRIAQDRGDYDEAQARYEQSLQIDERLGNQSGIASGYGQLGSLAQDRGDYDEARARYEQSLHIEEELGNPAGMTASYHNLGVIAQLRGDYEEARGRYEQALQISERLGNQVGMASGYGQLGRIAQDRGDYEEARGRYEQALQISERLGHQADMATGYHQLGTLAQFRGDYDEAQARYEQSLQINERLGNQAGIASGYHQLGRIAQLRGDYDEAQARYEQSLQIKERLGNQAGMAITISQLAILAAALGNLPDAVGLHGRALMIRSKLGVPQISNNVQHLIEHRATLGDAGFLAALTAGIGAENSAQLLAALDDLARRQAETEPEDPSDVAST